MLRAKESSRLVATIWKTVPAVPFGTVNSPELVMAPPLADQVTGALVVSLNKAVNWTFAPGATVGFSGMTLMVAAADPFVVELDALGAVAGEHARVASNGS
ncbi:MAG: hypothetical protein WB762_01195, partial [Candidatus Sulfotelmatobacter sp.]